MKKNKDFFVLSNVNRETWGVIHYLGYLGKEKLVQQFFRLISRFFVCPKCRRHITEFLNANRTPSTFDDTVFFHNAVNERIGKAHFGENEKEKLREYFEPSRGSFVVKNSEEFFFKDGLTGFYYVILLTFYHSKELYYGINEAFDYIFIPKEKMEKIQTFEELFTYMCSLPLDRNIFFEENYENIRLEISTEDFKPYNCC